MKEYTFKRFKITINDNDNCSVSFSPLEDDGEAFNPGRRKIYIVSYGKKILYVGETKRSIKARLRNSKKYGHKFFDKNINRHRKLILSVAVFENNYDDNKEFIEAIEAEIVYLVRTKLNCWPTFQNEIHFNNVNANDARKKAKYIYEDLKFAITH